MRVRKCIKISIGPNSIEANLTTFEGLSCKKEHFALSIQGTDPSEIPLVRIHSECLTGDVFLSSRCDCGDQLSESISILSDIGGVIIYLRQEGRGIGLYNKIDAYSLQDLGHNTFEANEMLGYPQDMRDYKVAGEILSILGIKTIDLLTNNPDKIRELQKTSIKIRKQINTKIYRKKDNLNYLKAKVSIRNHQMKI